MRGEARKDKPRIIRWEGLLDEADRRTRIMLFVIVAILETSLTFTQLGFIGIGMPSSYVAYAITLIAPLAMSALMLGPVLAAFQGLVSGCVLYAHALFQPLDYYEWSFVSPTSSIVLFTLTGFMFGLSFAIALRNNPSTKRRVVYIVIVCLIGSFCFSLLFWFYLFVSLVVRFATMAIENNISIDTEQMQVSAAMLVNSMGNFEVQWSIDALLAALLCIGFDRAVRWSRVTADDRMLRTTFREWLLVAVLLAFSVMAASAFVIITEQCKETARGNMLSEIDYLIEQLKIYDERIGEIQEILEEDAQSDEAIGKDERLQLKGVLNLETLLNGYSVEKDGTIIISKDDVVLQSNDPFFKPGDSNLAGVFGISSQESLSSLIESRAMIQIVYNFSAASISSEEDLEKLASEPIAFQIAFMCVGAYKDYTITMIVPATKVFETRTATMAWITLLSFALLLVVFLLVSRLLSLIVVRRIDETNEVLAEITDGNLDARVDIRDSREFKSLSSGINTTVGALKEWISEAESRMDRELATAKAIQESALPRIFPAFPNIQRFDIYASMHAAREVGGDFYDFFLIGDDADAAKGKLGFVIADVSGKGVPAALFMMTAKTQIRNYLESGVQPGEAIENANRQLCEGNDAGMFVTAFAGVLDYGTGHVVYVNAGHNPPLLWQTDSWCWLKNVSGMPLGLFDGLPYSQFELDMQVGDEFLLYTDGVTEAMNKQGELFGEERLEALAKESFYLHPRALLYAVRRELVAFTRGAEQSDDITMLSLEYGVPPELTATLVVPADVKELPNVLDFVHAELDRRLCPLKAQHQLDIAIEELYVNVAHYAYPDATAEEPGFARISYTYSAEPPSIEVEIADEGIAYNPLEKPDAITPDDIMEVPIGGLGILMAKRSVDEMEYERVDGRNVVTIRKKW